MLDRNIYKVKKQSNKLITSINETDIIQECWEK